MRCDLLPCQSDELEIVSSHGGKARVSVRPKLLKFHENYRPPYYGSYSKKSKVISARRPFAQDKVSDPFFFLISSYMIIVSN